MNNNVKSTSKVRRGINELEALLAGNDPGFVYHTRKIPTPPSYSAEEIEISENKLKPSQQNYDPLS
ncbi:hypothetical protein KTT66_11535 [Lacticaseibacillus casei]|jgi:hypothetical protein|uniref:Uncharacterized protein n=1 Tax=Lacticaseibacillus huelsenbergensis TaxID=3035291 RepID=A0ABY8DVS8_9LACO|nr:MULTISPECIES: hypothetical protein [Lacticaseibacillus]MDG3061459.1 hypothetical protein [Lacticaseibacillus sp. BCRC 81376]QVI36997.1 hypothetical protein KGS74_12350 [Lacticaseibacillus casei]QXG58788.1 hypothetical protein KTT66_11535 [Lacticaseibacillus casei]WFB39770.1 hypothetical protein LHUE1_000513 [Lacticaseibacillus huelsenbergensis]WFB41470.1 hypothetical protein LHUE2_002294 [Lacticaseibacillus huelsenbergensis]